MWERPISQRKICGAVENLSKAERDINSDDEARTGKIVPLGWLFSTISLEYWLRDLVTRGLLDAPPVPLSAFRQEEVPVSG